MPHICDQQTARSRRPLFLPGGGRGRWRKQICHPQPHRFGRLSRFQAELVLHITDWNLTNLSLFRNSVELLARTLCKKTEPWDFLRYSKSVGKDEKNSCETSSTPGNIIRELSQSWVHMQTVCITHSMWCQWACIQLKAALGLVLFTLLLTLPLVPQVSSNYPIQGKIHRLTGDGWFISWACRALFLFIYFWHNRVPSTPPCVCVLLTYLWAALGFQ